MSTAALVPSPSQRRTDRGVGASSAAAAVGMSDYRTRLDAWLEATGRVAGFAGNEKTRWGETLEPVIRAHYVELNRVAVHVPPESLFHREHDFIRATPDGIVLDPLDSSWAYVGPQCKNVGLRMAPLWGDGAIPNDYLIQGVVEMAVTNLPRIDFAILIGGQEYIERTMWRDGELEAEVIEQLDVFWALVQSDTQPEIDESKAFRSHVLKQVKRKAMVEASTATLADMERWREVVVAMAKLKREEAVLKNRVVAELGAANANKMHSPIGDVTIGNPTRKTSWKEVANATRPVLSALPVIERELVALRGDVVTTSEDFGAEPALQRVNAMQALAQRIDALRAQLRLLTAMDGFDALVAAHTSTGDPRVNRPRAWTADIDGDEEEH